MTANVITISLSTIDLARRYMVPRCQKGVYGADASGTWRFRRVDIEDWINREASPKKDNKT